MTPAALPILDLYAHVPPAARPRPALRIVRDAGAVVLRRAVPADAPAVHALLDGFAARGLLLPRGIDEVLRTIRDFTVAVDDGRVVGSVSLRRYTDELAEVSALAVAGQLHGTGVGRRLVEAVIADARELGVRRLFALTVQEAFFNRLGFTATVVTEFPLKIAADCAGCSRRTTCAEIAMAFAVE